MFVRVMIYNPLLLLDKVYVGPRIGRRCCVASKLTLLGLPIVVTHGDAVMSQFFCKCQYLSLLEVSVQNRCEVMHAYEC